MERLLAGSSLTGLRIGLLRKGLPSERVPFGRIVAAGAETFALITPYKLPERQARELSPCTSRRPLCEGKKDAPRCGYHHGGIWRRAPPC
jgi:hypothetical protein